MANLTESGRQADGNRPYLSVGKIGQRRWVYLCSWRSRYIETGLGSIKDVALAHARNKARHASALLADGISPPPPAGKGT